MQEGQPGLWVLVNLLRRKGDQTNQREHKGYQGGQKSKQMGGYAKWLWASREEYGDQFQVYKL